MNERELPDGWTWCQLGDVGVWQSGSTPNRKSPAFFGGSHAWVKSGEVKQGKIFSTEEKITDLALKKCSLRINPVGTVLIAMYGANIGDIGILQIPATTNQAVCGCITNNSTTKKFLYHLLISLKDTFCAISAGGAQPNISKEKIVQTLCPLPPLNEQRRIANRIDALQARSRRAREALAQAQTLLEKFRQSVLSAAFRGDLTAKWRAEHPDAEPASELLKRIRIERRKRWKKAELAKYTAKGKTPPVGWQKKYSEPVQVDTTDLPELPSGWCWASLDEIASNVQYGTSEKTTDDADLPVLRMGNIVNGQLLFDNLKYLPASTVPDELVLNSGDILFNRTNSIELVGKSAVFRGKDKTTFASYLIRVSVISVPPELVSEYINSPFGRSWVLSVASQQVGQANVNGAKLKALAIPLPPEEEQKYIAHLLSKTRLYSDSVERTVNMSSTQCADLDQSILAKAFRGDLVPQDPNDEPASELLKRLKKETKDNQLPKRRRKAAAHAGGTR